MTSPLAVLLIIGSAVVGPIEAQPITDQVKMAVYDACIKRLGPSGDVAENNRRSYRCSDEAEKPVHYESLPELCERAMREAGGVPWPGDAEGKVYVLSGRQGTLVRCIPVPTGYKR